jgi:hypothetical protein
MLEGRRAEHSAGTDDLFLGLDDARRRRMRIRGEVIECGEDFRSEVSEGQGPEPQRGRVELSVGQPGDALAGLGSHPQPFPLAELVGDGLAGAAQVAQHLGAGEVRGLPAVADQQPDRDLRGDGLAGGGVGEAGRDAQAEVEPSSPRRTTVGQDEAVSLSR